MCHNLELQKDASLLDNVFSFFETDANQEIFCSTKEVFLQCLCLGIEFKNTEKALT